MISNTSASSGKRKIELNRVYRHHSGIRYRVLQQLLDATGYEKTGLLNRCIRYVQLDAGHNPAGTEYVRNEDDFLGESLINGESQHTFTEIDD